MINNVWNIARRDFKAYFTSPIAYIVIAGFMLILGWLFFWNFQHYYNQALQYQAFNMGKTIGLSEGLLRPFFGNMNVIFLFMVPFITMRTFAEERKLHTIELLMTSPLTLMEIILGKFLAAFLFVIVMLGLGGVYPIILFSIASPDKGVIVACYLGTLLMAGCYLSLGVLFSSLTENQIVAGALTFAAALFFWLVSWASSAATGTVGDIVGYLSLIGHFNNFSLGTLNTTDVVFYLSFIGLGLFFTYRALDSFRWR